MSELILWKNEQMDKLRKDIDSLFNQRWSHFGVGLFPWEAERRPSIEISEGEGAVFATIELSGINPHDLVLSVTNNTLTISGEESVEISENGEYYRRVTRKSGSFSRTVQLPCRVKPEEIKATYKKGTLNIVMPKWESAKAYTIKIEVK